MNNIFNYILLILYLISFIIGFSTIFYSVIYYIIERITWLKYYIVFLFLFGFLLLIRAIKLLSFLAIPLFLSNSIFNILYYFLLYTYQIYLHGNKEARTKELRERRK